MRSWMRRGTVALCAGLVLLATGCAPAPTGEELLGDAREVFLDNRAAGAEVQLAIYDGEWVVDTYGDTPRSCDPGGYELEFARSTPPEWQLDGTPLDAATQLEQWLENNGWTHVFIRTYTEGITDVVVEAENPDAQVRRLLVTFAPGELYDSALISLYSTCQPGDRIELHKLLNPDRRNLPDSQIEIYPKMEHPLAEPSFGRDEEGQRRFWPSTAGEVQD